VTNRKKPNWIEELLGPWTVRYLGQDLPSRAILQIEGEATAEDDEINGAIKLKIGAISPGAISVTRQDGSPSQDGDILEFRSGLWYSAPAPPLDAYATQDFVQGAIDIVDGQIQTLNSSILFRWDRASQPHPPIARFVLIRDEPAGFATPADGWSFVLEQPAPGQAYTITVVNFSTCGLAPYDWANNSILPGGGEIPGASGGANGVNVNSVTCSVDSTGVYLIGTNQITSILSASSTASGTGVPENQLSAITITGTGFLGVSTDPNAPGVRVNGNNIIGTVAVVNDNEIQVTMRPADNGYHNGDYISFTVTRMMDMGSKMFTVPVTAPV